ncbi:MAG: M48 family metalloprotease [Rhodospirillaceae bacterium]|nr:M48 family metalloprotease [Rhodospirillaceae bacterium]
MYATPLFRAAGLRAEDVKIFIVRDSSLNAFVAGGQNLFLNTGLILASKDANGVIGVIAHETGHIAGGHLSRVHAALAKGSAASILATILGGATAIATGRGDVGGAIALGGQSVATRNFLAYSRVQESAADHAALRFLDETGHSARGLLSFMEELGDQELLSPSQQDPYVRTHPLTRDRISAVGEHVKKSSHSDKPVTPHISALHERMKAKLYAFINPMPRTLRVYKASDTSLPSRYARAIGHYRQGKLDQALPLIDGLIADEPANPYFHELKGQMLFENGHLNEALVSYGQAAKLLPNSALIRRDLARAQIEYNQPAFLEAAVINLEAALAIERRSAFNWHLLAIAYGRIGDQGRSSLALAEEALIRSKPKTALHHAGRAQKIFPEGSREWLQAGDILLAAKGDAARQRRKEQQ